MSPRRFLQPVGIGICLLAALYLIGANLALNSGAGERLFNRRPQRVRFSWSGAWSLYPGHLAARGLRIEGRVRSRRWEAAADRATARFELWPLARREVRFSRLDGRGASARVWREAPAPTAAPGPAAQPPGARPKRRWLFRFGEVTVVGVQRVEIQGFSAHCGGEARGAFRFAPGREVAVERATLSCPAAELAAAGRTFARQVRLDATAELAAYAPRQHPGVRGFDFLSAELHARGRAEPVGRQLPLAMGILPAAGDLSADLVLAAGRLQPGSAVQLASADRSATLKLEVTGTPPATVLSVRAPRLEVPGAPGRPAALTTGPITLAASAPQTRLSQLLAVERQFRRARELPEGSGLSGELEAEAVRFDWQGRAHWQGEADSVRSRVDLGGLFHQRLDLDGLRAHGVAVRWRQADRPPEPGARRRWAIALRDAEIGELRELAIGELRLSGPALLAGSANFTPDRGIELPQAVLDAPALEVHDAEHALARSLQVHAELRVAPLRLGETSGRQALRATSGTLTVAGQVSSLRFLGRFLQRAPWLRLDGEGQLYSKVRLQDGKLEPGSEWRVEKGTLRAQILDDLATGGATLEGGVHSGPGGPEAVFDARLRGFRFAPAGARAASAYLRGDLLRIRLVSRDVDLAERVDDLKATVAMENAQVPDLRVYNDYLPSGAGVAITSGSGRLRLNWRFDLAAQRGTGQIGLDSPRIGVRFQDVDLAGRLRLQTSLEGADLPRRRFDLTGSELRLDEVSFREIGGDGRGADGWWARLRLTGGSFQWQRPLALASAAELDMKDSGFLLALFTRRKQKLAWFTRVLDVENLAARGAVRVDDKGLEIDPLRAASGPLDLRARLRLGKGSRRGQLYLSYGVLAAGVELRDGQRDLKLIRPLAWFESRSTLAD